MNDLIAEFLRQKRFAVVGSFRDESKYAYKIVKMLIRKGREVYPVNPRGGTVEGLICYKNVSAIPAPVDVVSLVTPPAVTETVLRECHEKKITRAWLQPGAENEEGIRYCRENGIAVVHGLCVMMEWV